VAVGKTLVSSGMIDRVAADLQRRLVEVPVGFKWFVDGLLEGSLGFGGEESAGASFLRRDGTAWSTDKDGIILGLLAAEITALTGRDPGEHYRALTERHGAPAYRRVDAPASREDKAVLKALSRQQVTATELAGDPIVARLTRAPGNDAPIGGLKVVTEHGWFAARYIELVRNMLVREDGDRLHLFSAVAPLWVAPGAHIAVQRAATRFGDIDLRLDASEGGATVTLSAAWSQAPKHLVVHAPWFVTLDGADTDIGTPQVQGNEVLVPPEATRVTLRWTRSEDEPDLSFATAIKILAAKRADPPTGLAARLLFTP